MAVVLVGSLASVAGTSVGAAPSSASSAPDTVRRADLAAELDLPGAVEVDLVEGRHAVYVLHGRDVGAGERAPAVPSHVEVTVAGPDGAPVRVTPERYGVTYLDRSASTDLEEVATFRVEQPGPHRVEVVVPEARRGDLPARAGLGPSVALAGGGDVTGSLLVALGNVTLVVGGLLLAVGLGSVALGRIRSRSGSDHRRPRRHPARRSALTT